jgi:hypothetical protein
MPCSRSREGFAVLITEDQIPFSVAKGRCTRPPGLPALAIITATFNLYHFPGVETISHVTFTLQLIFN